MSDFAKVQAKQKDVWSSFFRNIDIDFLVSVSVWGYPRKDNPWLQMYDSSLDIVSEIKDLGLLVSHNLSWNSNVNCIVSKESSKLCRV